MSISSLLLNFHDVMDAESNPLPRTYCRSGEQVLINVTIPLNLFLPFLFTTRTGKGMVPFAPCRSQNHHNGMWRPSQSQALIYETKNYNPTNTKSFYYCYISLQNN